MLKAKGWQLFQATSPLYILDVFLVGLVERIHINSRRVKAFYGTIPVEDSVLVKLQRLMYDSHFAVKN